MDLDAGLDARADDQQRRVRPALGDVLVLADEPRNRGRQADAFQASQCEEVAEERAELVARAMRLGGDAPALAERVSFVQPEDRLRVPDVDREEHRGNLTVSDTA